MNRSVINWIITAGVLTAGAAVSPPAIADPEGSVPTDGAKPGDDRGAAPRPERATGRSGGDNPAAGRNQGWPCEWERVCRRGQRLRPGGDSVIGIPPMVPSVMQRPVVERPPVAALNPSALEAIPAVVAPVDAAPTVAAPAAVAPAVLAPGAVLPAPFSASPPRPGAAPRGPAASAPGALPRSTPSPPAARPAEPPEAPAESADLLRLGYPDELRTADLGEVASLALPGLAALVGMTALGGAFGYRQAKAGYMLRAAGAGRFLR